MSVTAPENTPEKSPVQIQLYVVSRENDMFLIGLYFPAESSHAKKQLALVLKASQEVKKTLAWFCPTEKEDVETWIFMAQNSTRKAIQNPSNLLPSRKILFHTFGKQMVSK
jgi:hypothetical protein